MPKTDILLLYYYDVQNAGTITEHLSSFKKHSSFAVEEVNLLNLDSPNRIRKMDFSAVVLHYTLFGMQYYLIPEEVSYIVSHNDAVRVAFFQDEHHQIPKRFNYVNEYDVDMVYTLLDPADFRATYYKHTKAPVVLSTLPGYVSEELVATSEKLLTGSGERPIDIGYRGRRLDLTLGIEGQEKHEIGVEFKRRTQNMGLALDIETEETRRIYGDAWPKFIASCKAMLGVEAGIALFDFADRARLEARRLRKTAPHLSEQEIYDLAVRDEEMRTWVRYRTISPRHFEAAALKTCQILFEGRYSGIMEPDRHYIPLRKDFSNFDEVIEKFRSPGLRARLVDNAYRDLIASGRFSYRRFVQDFDVQLRLMGVRPGARA